MSKRLLALLPALLMFGACVSYEKETVVDQRPTPRSTVVVPQGSTAAPGTTVVVPQSPPPARDTTIVVPQSSPPPARDTTIVVPR
jgi:hypothetical protein